MGQSDVPDKWVVVRIEKDGDVVYKVLMSWYGGYLDGDKWKINSGIESITEDENCYMFIGYTGSVYVCNKNPNWYGMNSLASAIYDKLVEGGEKSGYHISLMDVSDEFMNIKYV